jgi:Domain of unknown function DUF302
MLETRSVVNLADIEAVLRAAAQRHNASLLVVSHLAQDALGFSFCFTKPYAALLAADRRFAAFLPCRVAAWAEGQGVRLETLAPSEFCRLLGRQDLEPLAAPMESALRQILEDSARPLTVSAHLQPAAGSPWGATEDQVNMRATLPQRIDCRGTKVEDEAGTGDHDSPGG